MNKTSRLLLPVVLLASLPAAAQYAGDGIANKVSVHGSVQADVLFPEDDYDIGTEHYSDKILGNFYANASVFSKYVDGALASNICSIRFPASNRRSRAGASQIFS